METREGKEDQKAMDNVRDTWELWWEAKKERKACPSRELQIKGQEQL